MAAVGTGCRAASTEAPALLLWLALFLPHVLAAPVVAQESGPAFRCEPGLTQVEGVVADMLSRVPLPGTAVSLQKPASFVEQIMARAVTDAAGRYRFCLQEVGVGWEVIAHLDTLASRTVPVTPGTMVDTLYLAWSRPVTLAGTVRVQETGAPIETARISIEGRPVRALTDGDGRFALRGIGAGPLVVRTSHVGYALRVDTVVAPSGSNLSLEIYLGAEAIELAPIVVSVRTPPSTRARGMNEMGMTPAQVAAALPRSFDFITMLREAGIPGLFVTGGTGMDGPCIHFLRSTGNCPMVQVFINGVRVSNPGLMVASLDPSMVEEFIVLRPAFAQFQYMGPLTPNGVLDITLK